MANITGVWLVEEVPGVPLNERYFIWCHGQNGQPPRGKLWQGQTYDEGQESAKANGITIDEFEPFNG